MEELSTLPPWQQPGVLSPQIAEQEPHRGLVSTTYPKAPYQAFDLPSPSPAERESIFHPVKAIEDLLASIERVVAQLTLLVKQQLLERTFSDHVEALGSTMFFEVEYRERKYLYCLSGSAVTLLYPGGSLQLAPGIWKNVSLPRGTKLTVQGGSDSSPTMLTFRHCDVPMVDTPPLGPGLALGNVGALSPYPQGATQENNSATGANAVVTATLPGAAGKSTWLTGFEVTVVDTAVGGSGAITISGIQGGPLTLEFNAQGVAATNAPLICPMSFPLQSSALNTAISISLGALGAGTGTVAIAIHGYVL